MITGANGFVGLHLADYLLASTDWSLCLVSRSAEGEQRLRARFTSYAERIQTVSADLQNADSLGAAIARLQPHYIFNLAALTSVRESISQPGETIANNIAGTLNLLEALREYGEAAPRTLVVGSSEEYGHVLPQDIPVDEQTEMRPENPYAVSKIATDMLGLQYHLAYKLPLVRVRPFNHIGPGQSDRFVTASFARQIALIEREQQEPVVRVGNLSAQRDFTDVRDMVRAYYLAITLGAVGEVYNIGSDRAASIQSVLDTLVNYCKVSVAIELDSSRLRPVDVPLIVCDSRKFRQLTGWQPTIPLHHSLADILDYWRSKV